MAHENENSNSIGGPARMVTVTTAVYKNEYRSVSELPQTNVQLFRQMVACGYSAEDVAAISRAYAFGASLFSGRYRSCGKPFVCHLVGTAAILVWLRAPVASVVCGLLHAAYQEGDFGNFAYGMLDQKRRRLRNAIGAEAEDLVAAYTVSSRTGPALIKTHRRFGELTDRERTILLVQLANELDDYRETVALYARNADFRQDNIRLSGKHQVELADMLGFPELAEALQETYDESLATEIRSELRSSEDNGYVLIPLSCRRQWPVVVRDILFRVRRRLRRMAGRGSAKAAKRDV
jgi:(p)ppGpp synthase/HD superfamily hydrolase